MPATVTVRDETLGGDPLGEWAVELLTECVTVRELIRSRVYQEVQDHNRRRTGTFRGLVRPTADEGRLNGPQTFRPVDWQAQFERAVEAFERGQVLILVGDRQAEALDDELTVGPGEAVTFLKLTLLIGG